MKREVRQTNLRSKKTEKDFLKNINEKDQNAKYHSALEEEKYLKKKCRDMVTHELAKTEVLKHQTAFLDQLEAKYLELCGMVSEEPKIELVRIDEGAIKCVDKSPPRVQT
jgi:predicted ribosome-associated RNA-binding protein Tma20